ncbi:DNA-binding transcriptional LysR family regulator [Novosphingobium chloroacetimidivorans]|uniref:DNA-binding transcriptional LysR family regulator n=1 Tax=Novosphingobium chloroacetimidivorans TaxID=1428314 RepID=A0A7W7K9F6_9SPHN|nr:LysR family transcriptional regulator [Novosphingobium chloroacetimidivorans]MBB4858656.1 DNA-binding transcriptional LysR family regulator [Novosphingobium chloroacetimidivorans]
MSGWNGIEEFVAVAAAGSFTRGAHAIGMSPTHVSRAVMALERRVQAQLFHRTTRSVRLTDVGRIFLERCERIIQERDEAIAAIGEGGTPQGHLRVTCSTTIGERFLAGILRRFADDHPELSITIDLTNRVVDVIAEGYDLAVRTGAVSDARLGSVQIASRALVTCASPAYLARAGHPDTVHDLAAHQCLPGTAEAWHYKVDGALIVHRPAGKFRCNSGNVVAEACLEGAGVCQLPDFYVRPHLQAGTLHPLLIDYAPDDEPIWVVYARRRMLVPKIRLAIESLSALASLMTRSPSDSEDG